ncbi:hypothetical protein BGW36DRAFT_7848 [Talaromyces proteolyticus]|uniref:Histone H4 n=1 Tax=Talaromyces proteolyticus TaxID=1131652 RepID=A0AAD4L706_9EURO|nr:uncharacterized protein BGW36DRAFT_7848 [Talaromyces proteolyticus]KAH8705124.1 hypothetical protein BGW36DRAFT_7848 [Talaromyces proteolyticus]
MAYTPKIASNNHSCLASHSKKSPLFNMPVAHRSQGLGVYGLAHRRRKVLRESIKGITKPAIRRLARRGGVVRISGLIYDEIRKVTRQRLADIIQRLVFVLESSSTPRYERKTVTTRDVVFVLNQMGIPVYGFAPN